MIFTMDIGNSNIKTGLFEGSQLKQYWRVSTNRGYSSDEYGAFLDNMFRHAGLSMSQVEGIMVSSVVPPINFTIDHLCRDYFGMDALFVTPGVKTGINILYENPRDLGADRICNAVAAHTYYGKPCIFIDFGTATSFGVVDAKGSFLGGCICPGIKLASEALVSGTSKLPHFELVMPERVIAKTTVSNLQAGVLYGYVGQVNYIIERMRAELGDPTATVVATGGLSRLIATQSKLIDHIDGQLTLTGLRLIYEKNH
ncbi:MAG: type III pantothenate kinase [Christensenellales bacterium]